MAQWDIYAQANPLNFDILDSELPGSVPFFKSESIEDYKRFRSFMQVADLLILDLDTFSFDKRYLVAALLYI